MKRFFTLEYWPNDNWFIGKIQKIPGVFSQGETLDELKENIADAYYDARNRARIGACRCADSGNRS